MKFVAVTACPTGIAHTYMAAEALEQAAKDAGAEIRVETQGSAGSSPLSEADVRAARALLWERLRVAVEPGAAVAAAALTSGALVPAAGERVAVVLCGGNADPGDLARVPQD